MIGALWTSASGLLSQRAAVDAISNNVANVGTTGFKRNITQFQDLGYMSANALGEFEPDNSSRTGISIGTGVRVASTQRIFNQGRLEATDNPYDVAIDGAGFFRIQLPDGTPAYTRDGSFNADSNGRLTTPQGYTLDPAITLPEGSTDLNILPNGQVRVVDVETGELREVGTITLFKFDNPNGLLTVGENVFVPTVASGNVVEEIPESAGVGRLTQGFVEGSNVEIADEMTQLVIAQRAYEVNSRALKTAEEMLMLATNIRA